MLGRDLDVVEAALGAGGAGQDRRRRDGDRENGQTGTTRRRCHVVSSLGVVSVTAGQRYR